MSPGHDVMAARRAHHGAVGAAISRVDRRARNGCRAVRHWRAWRAGVHGHRPGTLWRLLSSGWPNLWVPFGREPAAGIARLTTPGPLSTGPRGMRRPQPFRAIRCRIG